MSMQDPLGDMLTSIRNAQQVGKQQVVVPCSKIKQAVCDVLQEEGYIESAVAEQNGVHRNLKIVLRYHKEQSAIRMIGRISRPGLRRYLRCDQLPRIYNGLGITVVSTSKGVMSDRKARQSNLGGELICQVF